MSYFWWLSAAILVLGLSCSCGSNDPGGGDGGKTIPKDAGGASTGGEGDGKDALCTQKRGILTNDCDQKYDTKVASGETYIESSCKNKAAPSACMSCCSKKRQDSGDLDKLEETHSECQQWVTLCYNACMKSSTGANYSCPTQPTIEGTDWDCGGCG